MRGPPRTAPRSCRCVARRPAALQWHTSGRVHPMHACTPTKQFLWHPHCLRNPAHEYVQTGGRAFQVVRLAAVERAVQPAHNIHAAVPHGRRRGHLARAHHLRSRPVSANEAREESRKRFFDCAVDPVLTMVQAQSMPAHLES